MKFTLTFNYSRNDPEKVIRVEKAILETLQSEKGFYPFPTYHEVGFTYSTIFETEKNPHLLVTEICEKLKEEADLSQIQLFRIDNASKKG
jgi:hypothetical protein